MAPRELDLLFAGPPCQGFSIIGSRVVWDERNNLFREVLRLAAGLQPRCVVIENVPGLVTLAKGAYLRAILEGLSELGYEAACAELLAAQYGAPQMRWRLLIIGWRRDLGIPAGYGFPAPTAGRAKIGDLLPNCTIPPWQLEGFVTAAQAFSDLPPVDARGRGHPIRGAARGPYQEDDASRTQRRAIQSLCRQAIACQSRPASHYSGRAKTGETCRENAAWKYAASACARTTPAGTGG